MNYAAVQSEIAGIFPQISQILLYGFFGVLAIFIIYTSMIVYWRFRGNSAHTSYQYGVVAPVQYGDRGVEERPVDAFSERLEGMVKAEEAYDLSRILPSARQLGALADTTFRTAPVLDPSSASVLALIESVVAEKENGCRVLVHTSLESMVDLAGAGAGSAATRLTMAGIDLKFAVMDRFGRLVLAVDHLNGAERGRQDYINRSVVIEVLRKAGVWYLEIPQYYSQEDARAQINAVLTGKAVACESGAEVA